MILNSDLTDNSVGSYGGAIAVDGNNYGGSINGCQIVRNIASESGGGLFISISNIGWTLNQTKFFSNLAPFGAGIFLAAGNTELLISGCQVEFNYAAKVGGGLFIGNPNDNFLLSNSSFGYNTAESGGSAIFTYSDYAVISDCFFEYNSGQWAKGVFSLRSVSYISINRCVFTRNTGDSALDGEDCFYLRINSSVFTENWSPFGGSLLLSSSDDTIIENTKFVSSLSYSFGGALALKFCNIVTLFGCSFISNIAFYDGDAISAFDVTDLRVHSSLFYCNVASSGGALVALMSTVSLITVTMSSNEASNHHGGAILLVESVIKTTGSKFDDNSAENGGGGAIYWNFQNTSAEPLPLTELTLNNTFDGNHAGYGDLIATPVQSMRLYFTNSSGSYREISHVNSVYIIDVTEYAEPISPVLVILYDYYGSKVATDNSSVITLTSKSLNLCENRTTFIAGDVSEHVVQGEIDQVL